MPQFPGAYLGLLRTVSDRQLLQRIGARTMKESFCTSGFSSGKLIHHFLLQACAACRMEPSIALAVAMAPLAADSASN